MTSYLWDSIDIQSNVFLASIICVTTQIILKLYSFFDGVVRHLYISFSSWITPIPTSPALSHCPVPKGSDTTIASHCRSTICYCVDQPVILTVLCPNKVTISMTCPHSTVTCHTHKWRHNRWQVSGLSQPIKSMSLTRITSLQHKLLYNP